MDSDEESDASDATCWSSSDSDCDQAEPFVNDAFDRWVTTSSLVAKRNLQQIQCGKQSLSDFCVACWIGEGIVDSHPLFKGGVCSPCKQRLLRVMYAVDPKGVHLYCAVCGSRPEKCAICCQEKCSRNYCFNCLTIWCSDWQEIADQINWSCFMCQVHVEESEMITLEPRSDWMERILSFHEPTAILAPKAFNWTREPLRVLSLFDGIGTGLFVLKHLGIEVETYWASEIFTAATTVSRTRLGAPIRHVGSVGEITRKRLEAMRPIHLLVGGSPCNDFSAINRFPKDFYDPKGSTRYFYDFFRVLRVLQEINGDQHILWLYENVASMPRTYRERISKHLQCEPAIIDAKDFSPQLRKRFFWGNIPGLYTIPSNNEINGELTLDMTLIPNSGRRAALDKIRTLTTNSNSLYQGRKEYCRSQKDVLSLFPVHWDSDDSYEEEESPSKRRSGKKRRNCDSDEDSMEAGCSEKVDVLWLPEIEEVFGYPRHYTDVGNLSRGDRQKLLGHTWSVPIIAFIMSKLKNYTLPAAETSTN